VTGLHRNAFEVEHVRDENFVGAAAVVRQFTDSKWIFEFVQCFGIHEWVALDA